VRNAAQPGLYDPQVDDPVLTGVRCASCGHTAFPPYALGCESCGATENSLALVPLSTRGVVHSYAHVQHQPIHGARYTVLEISLADGPLIRAIAANEDSPSIGQPVRAIWRITSVDDDGIETVEPVFTGDSPEEPA
jgi:uncharacterized OB-fold protein